MVSNAFAGAEIEARVGSLPLKSGVTRNAGNFFLLRVYGINNASGQDPIWNFDRQNPGRNLRSGILWPRSSTYPRECFTGKISSLVGDR